MAVLKLKGLLPGRQAVIDGAYIGGWIDALIPGIPSQHAGGVQYQFRVGWYWALGEFKPGHMCGVALVREENKIPVFFPCSVYVKIRIIKIVQKATLQIITMYSNTVQYCIQILDILQN